MNWLDTETKAILRKEADPKLAPPKAGEFALVLLRKGADEQRMVRAVRRINECGESEAFGLVHAEAPVLIDPGLTEPEALFGQFELICCDAAAAFIRSEVLFEPGQNDYLHQLFQKILESPEFEPTHVDVLGVPCNEEGERFVDQFLGERFLRRATGARHLSVGIPLKKARVMKHWAARIGADVRCSALDNVQEPGGGV